VGAIDRNWEQVAVREEVEEFKVESRRKRGQQSTVNGQPKKEGEARS
jgi:hypothetical protein